jgi:hypothetical protein
MTHYRVFARYLFWHTICYSVYALTIKIKGKIMIKTLLFLAISTLAFASGSHHMAEMKTKAPKHPKVYNSYKLVKESMKPATAVYLDTCGNQLWKQDASKVKACPYCGPAMPDCGKLVKVLPKRGVKYDWSDYDLPNKICPVSGEEIENAKHTVEADGNKISLCCKSCVKKFKKYLKKGKLDKILRKLSLNPEKFGFSNGKSMNKQHDHSSHGTMKKKHDHEAMKSHTDHSNHNH